MLIDMLLYKRIGGEMLEMLSDSVPFPYTKDDAILFINKSHKNYKEHYKKGDAFFDIIDYGVVEREWKKESKWQKKER